MGYSMIRSKTCFKCNTVKPFEDFYKHQKMPDGHVNKCKACNKQDVTDNRNKNLERIREYDRMRGKNADRIKATTEITRAWRDEDKRRGAAHSAVARAVKSGLLIRGRCMRCTEPKTVAHHDDYDKPLDVMWLCQPCHKQRHKELLTGE